MANFATRRGLRANLPATRNPDTLYFTTDTSELFLGEQSFTRAVRTGSSALPTSFAVGVLYVLANGEGWTHNGSAWINLFGPSPFDNLALTNNINTNNPSVEVLPTESAVVGHVLTRIHDVNAEEHVITDMVWDPEAHSLTFRVFGNTQSQTIQFGALMAGGVEDGFFDSATGEIVFVLASGTEIRIPAADFITPVVSGSVANDTVQVSVVRNDLTHEDEIRATVRVATSTFFTVAQNGELTFNDSALQGAIEGISALATRVTDLENRLTWGSF
jgi:hypothetical protein